MFFHAKNVNQLHFGIYTYMENQLQEICLFQAIFDEFQIKKNYRILNY